MNNYIIEYIKKFDRVPYYIFFILLIYISVTLAIWKKYNWEPTSMIHFGNEFVELNLQYMPPKAVVEKGYEGDLGAGYDGQIFYFYSRAIHSSPSKWPEGFDYSYRAPRIGYPILTSIFGVMGEYGTIFGMYFFNIFLFIVSLILLRKILNQHSYLAWFYAISPFSLGSYTVLVSDSVMASLVIIAYYMYIKEKYLFFIVISSLAILTKEPSLFLFFPLGLDELKNRNWKKVLIVLSILILPALWHTYLRLSFPNWKSARLLEFILPFEGIMTYLNSLYTAGASSDFREFARAFSRFPLFILLIFGIFSIFTGNLSRGLMFRIGLAINFFTVIIAGYYHYWSVYENVSRLFTISVPLMILLVSLDEDPKKMWYLYLLKIIFLLFLIKIFFIQKAQDYFIWNP